jgi:flagellar biosynthesis protein FlhG
MIDVSDRLTGIRHAVELTGLEESQIRYYELEFGDLFAASGIDINSRLFGSRRIQLLRQIDELSRGAGQPAAEIRKRLAVQTPARARTRVIAFTSGKGGVGKTSVAINFALAVSRLGWRTLLADVDLGMANVHVYAGLAPRRTIIDLVTSQFPAEQTLTPWQEGIHVICGDSGIARMAGLDRPWTEHLGRRLAGLAAGFDVVVLDTAAGVSHQVMHFLGMADDVILVSTPNIAATLDAYGVIKMARQSRLAGRIHLLMNLVEGRPEAHAVYEKINACAQRFLGFSPRYLGYLIEDPLVDAGNQARCPLLISHPESVNGRFLMSFASGLLGVPPARPVPPSPRALTPTPSGSPRQPQETHP